MLENTPDSGKGLQNIVFLKRNKSCGYSSPYNNNEAIWMYKHHGIAGATSYNCINK